jgi:XXXCH domain-containing protein
MGSKEVKIEKQLSVEDTGSFLQTLADALVAEPKVDLSSYGIDLHDFKKIKMDLKKEGDLFGLKLKVKYSTPVLDGTREDAAAPMKYKTLKKQMKNSFKTLKTSIEGGSLPDKKTVEMFMQQAEMMVSFTDSGYGDEYYDEFIKLCHEFKQTFVDGDFDKIVTAFNGIDARKALCHDKYD